jgi:hypothetical protein
MKEKKATKGKLAGDGPPAPATPGDGEIGLIAQVDGGQVQERL